MQINSSRRKRKRKPTSNGRFGGSSLALEIGLVRMALEAQREYEKKEAEGKRDLR